MKQAKQKSTKKRKLLFAALLLVLFIGLVAAAINLYVCLSTVSKILPPEDAASFDGELILVLGAGVREDGTPSPMLEDRLITGVALYQVGEGRMPLLMSGDASRKGYDEVSPMAEYARENGVAEEAILRDPAGLSTFESLRRAKETFGVKRLVIVSQKYHLYRALSAAKALGLDAVGVSADLRPYRGQWLREVREVLARVKDFALSMAALGTKTESVPVLGS